MEKENKYEKMLWDIDEIDNFIKNKDKKFSDIAFYFMAKFVLDKISKKADAVYSIYLEQAERSGSVDFIKTSKKEQKETVKLLQEIEQNIYKSISEKNRIVKSSFEEIDKAKQNFSKAYKYYYYTIESCGMKPYAEKIKKEQKLYDNCFYFLKQVDNKYCKEVRTLEKKL